MFYLFSTHNLLWARGHAVSDDLVHWQDLPLAIWVNQDYEVTKNWRISGLGTGQVWAGEDQVIMGYVGTGHASACLAMARDPLLVEWKKHPRNPVIQPGNDNFVWREGEFYYLTSRWGGPANAHSPDYQRKSGGRTTLELHRSRDLTTWESLGKLFEDRHYTDPGEDCACNSFLPIGKGKHLVLFYSHKRSAQYYLGTYDREQHRFTIENHGRMTYGRNGSVGEFGSLHAPSAFIGPQGRCLGIWNIRENRPQEGWRQIISLPRKLSVNEKGSSVNPLCIEPIEEMKRLRFDPVRIENVTIPANGEKVLGGIKGKAMELEAVIDPLKAREVGLHVLRSPNGEEQTTLTLFVHARPNKPGCQKLAIDVSRASVDPVVKSRPPEIGPLYLKDGEPLRLRVFIDRSIVEVFANGRQCLTLRTYPSREDSTGVSLFARGSEARLVALNAYQMRSIWTELKHKEGK